MPRPPKITRERIEVIVAAIGRGDYKVTAAGLAGISRQTLDNWLARGEAEANEGEIDPTRYTRKELETIARQRQIDIKGCRNKAAITKRINAQPSLYLDFFDAYTRAYAQAESVALNEAVRTGRDDWRFWMTFLERSRPNRWGRRQRTDDDFEDETMAVAGDEVDAQRQLDRATEIRIKMLGTGTEGE